MVPVIDDSRELGKILNYNENKVARGVAEFLHAGNFLPPKEELTFYHKFRTFENLNELNQRAQVNTLHISLNFHPEDDLNREKLTDIATLYMERIGFGNQPYLVYQHFDAGHPHIHIITTMIQSNGKRINVHNIGKEPSVAARKEIDQLYGLRRVEDSQHSKTWEPTPANAQKLEYGKSETKKAVNDVLSHVLAKYKFTSLPELNAILQQYNVMADRGGPDSRVYKNGGLVYRVLDEKGNKTGVPIKASDFHFKPTLAVLQEKFGKNKPFRDALLPRIKSRIDWTLGKQPGSFKAWVEELRKVNIQVVIRRNKEGLVYGLTFVDFKNRAVFNGSDLGKAYSANAINQRFGKADTLTRTPVQAKKTAIAAKKKVKRPSKQRPDGKPARSHKKKVTVITQPVPKKGEPVTITGTAPVTHPVMIPFSGGGTLLGELLTTQTGDPLPYELTTDRKKKEEEKAKATVT